MLDPTTRFVPRTKFDSPPFYRGVAEGKAEGKAEGEAEAILTVLSARGLTPSEAQRQRIIACRDRDRLKLWLGRAATMSSLDAVFD